MNVLHTAAIYKPSTGIAQQMLWEKQAAAATNLPWHVELYVPDALHNSFESYRTILCRASTKPASGSSIATLTGWLTFQKSYYQHLLSVQHNYDVLLVRYNTHDPLLPWFLRQVKTPVFTVHHALEGPELRSSHTLIGYARGLADWAISCITLRHVKGILAVTSEIAHYEAKRSGVQIPWVFFPNGYYGQTSALSAHKTDNHEVIFVASKFAPWQGLDKLLAALSRSSAPLIIHIVGDLSAEQESACRKDPRIKVHGVCTLEQIKTISERCSAGLSAFALEREGMQVGCTLKVRQYLATGLPVYAGHLDIFPDDVEFYQVGPCDIDQIAAFCDRMQATTRQYIIDRAWPYISKNHILIQAYQDLQEMLSVDGL